MDNYTIIIDGGAGRVVSAIPALEKFIDQHPDTNIIVGYWTPILWGNTKLQDKVFDDTTKGVFEKVKDTKIIHPEPYHDTDYLNGRISLSQAFDKILNGSTETNAPRLYVSHNEEKKALVQLRKFDDKRLTIGFQPFGSSAFVTEDGQDIIDDSCRSVTLSTAHQIINGLRSNYNVVIFTHSNLSHFFNDSGALIINESVDIRQWASLIKNLNYMVSIDSVCQHIARSFDVPGTVIMGGTNTINSTYPDWFSIIERNNTTKYNYSFRLASFDGFINSIVNSSTINFSKNEVEEIIKSIKKNICGCLEEERDKNDCHP